MRFRRPVDEEPEVNLMPLIDVLLIVLIFLAYQHHLLEILRTEDRTADGRRAHSRRRARTRSTSPSRRRPLRDRAETDRIARRPGVRRGTAARPRRARKRRCSIVNADAQAPHQSVISVMEAARLAGHCPHQLRDPADMRRAALRSVRMARRRTRLQLRWSSWQGRGPLAWLLSPLSLLHLPRLQPRARRSTRSVSCARRGRVPVVVIGNLYVGGTGKTPLTIELVRALAVARLASRHRVARLWGAEKRQPRMVAAGDTAGSRRRAAADRARHRMRRWRWRATGPPRRSCCVSGIRNATSSLPTTACSTGRWRATWRSRCCIYGEASATAGCCRPGRCASRAGDSTKSMRSCATATCPAIRDVGAAVRDAGDAGARRARCKANQLRRRRPAMAAEQRRRQLAHRRRRWHRDAGALLRDAARQRVSWSRRLPLADHFDFWPTRSPACNCDCMLLTEKDAVKCRRQCDAGRRRAHLGRAARQRRSIRASSMPWKRA